MLTYEDVIGGDGEIGERVLILDEQGDRVSPGLASCSRCVAARSKS